MPEGHTIHRMARDHLKLFGGKTVQLSSPQGRFEGEARRLNHSVFQDTSAHGKHLFYHLTHQDNPTLYIHIHLGLFGRFRRQNHNKKPSPNCRLRIRSGEDALDLSGPTCCEILTKREVEEKCRKLGPDPLGRGDVSEFRARLARRRIPIGAALLDQGVIAGLGNIYRAELLFRHRIDPYTPAKDLEPETIEALWHTAKWWLTLGVRANRIITTLDEQPKRVPLIPRREAVLIYGKPCCPQCGVPTSTALVGNRKLFYCQACQQKDS